MAQNLLSTKAPTLKTKVVEGDYASLQELQIVVVMSEERCI